VSFPGSPVLVDVPARTTFVRLYDARYYADGLSFRHVGPHRAGRFDHHPPGPERRSPALGVLYATGTLRCAVAEVFGDDRLVAPLPSHRLAVLETTRRLQLADVSGRAAVELGHPAGALRARDRDLTQAVARELHATTRAAGIRYEGWFTGEPCVALWERAKPGLELVDDRGLDDPAVAADLLVIAAELHYRAGDLGPF
jgi:hypothetical protein